MSTAPRAHAREALYALEDPAAGFVFDDFDRRYCEAERNRDLLWCDLPPHPLRLKAAHGLLMAEEQDVPWHGNPPPSRQFRRVAFIALPSSRRRLADAMLGQRMGWICVGEGADATKAVTHSNRLRGKGNHHITPLNIIWVADIPNPVFDRINMIYRIFEHMVHASMRLEGFNTCINPVNLVNPVENAICGVSCKCSQSATQ